MLLLRVNAFPLCESGRLVRWSKAVVRAARLVRRLTSIHFRDEALANREGRRVTAHHVAKELQPEAIGGESPFLTLHLVAVVPHLVGQEFYVKKKVLNFTAKATSS